MKPYSGGVAMADELEERRDGEVDAATAKRSPSGIFAQPESARADSGLAQTIERVGALAAAHAGPDDVVSGIIVSEQRAGQRVCLCSFDDADGRRSWLAIRNDGAPVTSRAELRAAVSIAALCEVAEDAAGGGDLDALIATLVEIRETEAPPGIEDTEEAARALRTVLGDPPQVASATRLDEIGAATRRLERELDSAASSPFAAALKSSQGAVSELEREIEAGYRIELT